MSDEKKTETEKTKKSECTHVGEVERLPGGLAAVHCPDHVTRIARNIEPSEGRPLPPSCLIACEGRVVGMVPGAPVQAGPARVSSEAFRSGWERTFGQRELN